MGIRRKGRGRHASEPNAKRNTKRFRSGPHPMGIEADRHPHKYTVHTLKERIRDIKRVLSHVQDMPADRRVELERELNTKQFDLEIAQSDKHKQEMVGRYHMVRFFGTKTLNFLHQYPQLLTHSSEKQKASRFLKKARKLVDSVTTPRDIAIAGQEYHAAKIDLDYATYFPLDLPYVSLYPTNKDNDGKTVQGNELIKQSVRGDQEIRHMVEECTANNTLENLRSGILTKDRSLANMTLQKMPSNLGSNDNPAGLQGNGKKQNVMDEIMTADDADSDGGFFEGVDEMKLS
ncbi:MAG: hypothetical protein Q9165_007668 [Trypethelium subeluteriae]